MSKIRSSSHWFLYTKEILSLLANFAIVLGILFAIIQINNDKKIERKKIAIETIDKTRTQEFIRSYVRIKRCIENNEKHNIDEITFQIDINYIANIYGNIQRLYNKDLVEKHIIKDGIQDGLSMFCNLIKQLDVNQDKYKYLYKFEDELKNLKK